MPNDNHARWQLSFDEYLAGAIGMHRTRVIRGYDTDFSILGDPSAYTLPPTQPKQESNMLFNIGDKVRVLTDGAFGARVSKGEIGEIVELRINQTQYRVYMNVSTREWIFRDLDIELVESVESQPLDARDPYTKSLADLTDKEKSDMESDWDYIRWLYQNAVFNNSEDKMWNKIIYFRKRVGLSLDVGAPYSKGFIIPGSKSRYPRNPYRLGLRKIISWVKEIRLEPNNSENITSLIKAFTKYAAYESLYGISPGSLTLKSRDKVKRLLANIVRIDYLPCSIYKDTLVHPENVFIHEGGYYCERAYEEVTSLCPICSFRYTASRGLIFENDEGEVQNICRECYTKETTLLMSHSANVLDHLPTFLITDKEKIQESKTGKKQELFFGIELEVLPRGKVASPAAIKSAQKDMKGFACMKSDGSLQTGGFEIVTTPASLNFHRETLWNKFFDQGGGHQKVKSWNTTCCGLHIHFSRHALTPMQMGKFFVFMHEPNNNIFLTKLAGRDIHPQAEWCKTVKKKLSKKLVVDYDENHAEGREYYTHDHYQICNISPTTDYNTCEVRMFRGNASRHGVMRALDFVAALIQYCGNASAEGLNSNSFLAWFNRPEIRSFYPDLWRQLISLRCLKTSHKFKVIKGGKLIHNRIKNEVPDAFADRVNEPEPEEEYEEEESA